MIWFCVRAKRPQRITHTTPSQWRYCTRWKKRGKTRKYAVKIQ